MIELLRRVPASRWLLAGMAVSSLGTGLTLPFLVVYLHAVRGIPLPLAGLALAAAGVIGLGAGLWAGRSVDRLGAGPMLVFGLALEAVGATALAGVTTAWQAVVVASLVGAAGGVTWPALGSLVAGTVPAAFRPRAFATQFLLMNLGIGLGGLVSGSVVSLHDPTSFQIIYLADGASFLIFALVLLWALGAGAMPSRSPSVVGERAGTPGGSYLGALQDRPFRLFLMCSLGFVLFGYSQVDAGFSVFATEFVHVSPRIVGAAFAANCSVIVATQALVTRVSEHRSRTRSLAAGALVVAVSWSLVGIADLPHLGPTGGAAILILAAGVFGLGETLVSPVASTLVNELAPDHLRGRYNALAASVWGVTGIVGPPFATSLLAVGIPALWIGPLVLGSLLTALGDLRLGRMLPAPVELRPS